ncbi:unnamed protein product [Gadus morhua 'NCC']
MALHDPGLTFSPHACPANPMTPKTLSPCRISPKRSFVLIYFLTLQENRECHFKGLVFYLGAALQDCVMGACVCVCVCVREGKFVSVCVCEIEERVRVGEVANGLPACLLVMLHPPFPDVPASPPPHPSTPATPQAPSSLLEALEQHLASLEGRKIKELSAANSTGIALSRMDDKTDDNKLQQHKEGPKVIDIQTPNVSPSTQSVGSANSSGGANDLFANSPVVPISNHVPNLTSELFSLQPSFTPIPTTHTVPNNNNAWGGDLLKSAPPPQIHSQGALCILGRCYTVIWTPP